MALRAVGRRNHHMDLEAVVFESVFVGGGVYHVALRAAYDYPGHALRDLVYGDASFECRFFERIFNCRFGMAPAFPVGDYARGHGFVTSKTGLGCVAYLGPGGHAACAI